MKAFFLLAAACVGLVTLGATVPLRSGEWDRQELRGVRLEVTWLVGNNLSYSPEEDLKLPVELVFTNDGRKGQRFNTTEYFFTLLDSEGRQVPDGLRFRPAGREVVLSTTKIYDRPTLFLNTELVQDGKEYSLLCVVRGVAVSSRLYSFQVKSGGRKR
jgi:hypothetical protein